MTGEDLEIVNKAVRLIEAGRFKWSDAAVVLHEALMAKYNNCVRNMQSVPQRVFEANNRGTKTCNSDVAILDPKRRIYLVPREKCELWEGQLHLPGTTHRYEWLQEATERLLGGELKNFELEFENLHRAGVIELQDEPRAMCQSNLFFARIQHIPIGKEGMFYAKDHIPWERVVYSHRTVTLPWLINNGYFGYP